MPTRRGHGQQGDDRTRGRPDVGGIDAAVGAHEPVSGLGDDDAVRHADDALRLAQDDLDLARVAIPALGEGDRLRSRLDVGQVDDGALGLGDDLLGHDQDVGLGERRCAGRAVDGVSDERGQVRTRGDLRDAGQGKDLDGAVSRHGRRRFGALR